MAASVARESQGIIFQMSSISTGVMVSMGEVLSFTPPTNAMGTIDITNHGTTDYFREFLPGLIDPGSLTFTANYICSTVASSDARNWCQGLITDLQASRTKIPWRFILSGTSTQNMWYGNGYITNYQLITANDQAVQYSVSLKVTGKPTFSADETT
jgi:predicted secreted protein